jgi:hypothetical protein
MYFTFSTVLSVTNTGRHVIIGPTGTRKARVTHGICHKYSTYKGVTSIPRPVFIGERSTEACECVVASGIAISIIRDKVRQVKNRSPSPDSHEPRPVAVEVGRLASG